ncbi:hypothetical protein [Streptomyces sp. SLBN-31]|uniref:hypothetical protein n=1 Tax=Streptomyces sp. SLBN-31 TaxID=2768444 RepID=UPI00114FFE38|nr:hypothetical protein [Streptomyces sp. SLBN-31]TQJ90468.1 hypothetical protein FBY22_1255 [Streptomyces sp. SLBN-31]
MGVFARLLRRSNTTEEASPAEVPAAARTAGAEAEEAAEAKGSAGTEERAGTESTATEAREAGSDEGVEIPKQQSAEDAADSEAGEGART